MADMAKLNEDTKAVIKQLELLGIVNRSTRQNKWDCLKTKGKFQAIKKSPIFWYGKNTNRIRAISR